MRAGQDRKGRSNRKDRKTEGQEERSTGSAGRARQERQERPKGQEDRATEGQDANLRPNDGTRQTHSTSANVAKIVDPRFGANLTPVITPDA